MRTGVTTVRRLRDTIVSWSLVLGVLSTAVASALAAPAVYPTGVTTYDPTRAHNSYVIFSAPDLKTHLIDMNGNEVHQWPYFGFPAGIIDPSINGGKRGHVLVQFSRRERQPAADLSAVWFFGVFNNKTVAELDWDGQVVWQWGEQAPGGAARQDHEWVRLANGNTLLLTQAVTQVPAIFEGPLHNPTLYEVSPAGEIVWSWSAAEHLDEFGFSQEGVALIRQNVARVRGRYFINLNNAKIVGPNRWFDQGDARFAPENIIIDSRDGNFIAIIERKTGKIVWRLGPYYGSTDAAGATTLPHEGALPGEGDRFPRPIDQISGQHDAHLIAKGLPGEGNLLVFDNQGPGGYPPAQLGARSGSRVLEIDPVAKQIVWEYSAEDSQQAGWTFVSYFISSARRLPNGNTLIDEGMNGRFFQVTPKGEIVWEYISPYFGVGLLSGRRPLNTNWVYRAVPVPYDWVPEGTPHSELPVIPPDVKSFHLPAGNSQVEGGRERTKQ